MNSPKLRFKEFSGQWTLDSLDKVTSVFKSGSGITSEDIHEVEKYPVYGGNGLRGYTNKYTHDGTYALIGRQGALCGNIKLVSGQNFISEHAIAVQGNEKCVTTWLAIKLALMNLNRLSESSAQPGLAVNKLLKLKLYHPSVAEQTKIADFVTSIDQATRLLEQKESLLNSYKKGVMQKIFSRKIGFADKNLTEWNSLTIGEVFNDHKGSTLSKESLSNEGRAECILYGELFTKYKEVINQVTSRTDSIHGTRSKRGDLLMPSSTTTKAIDLAIASALMEDDVLLGGDIIILRPKIPCDSRFMAYYFTHCITKELAKKAQGSTIIHMYFSKIKDISIKVPSLEEQARIADFLCALDFNIQAITTRIDLIKKYKQGLLQQMFV